MTTCDSLGPFCDGELDTPQAYEFRDHLKTCGPCQAGCLQHYQLCARLSDLAPRIETQPVRVPVEPKP